MVTDGTTLSTEQVHAAVEAASLAPSVHNSQPWKWRLRGDALELTADLSRAVPVLDPEHRQLVVSCGGALLAGWLTLRAAGLDVEVDELPDGPDITTGRLATLRVIGHREATAEETQLAAAIRDRHTDRRPFEPGEVTVEQVRALRHAAEAEGCWLTLLTSEDARVKLAVLLTRADWVEQHDPDYQAELAAWSRADPEATDGIPLGVVTGTTSSARASEFPLRDFTGGTGDGTDPMAASSAAARAQVERPDVLVLGTDADGPADRLRAGRALERVLLTATAAGLATSPLGQAVDITATRALVREAIGGTGHTQMIIRVGYPNTSVPPLPATKRRPVSDVLVEDLGATSDGAKQRH